MSSSVGVRTNRGGNAAPTPLPQVNLLPPEIRSARAFARVKRLLVFGLVAVVVLVAVGFGVVTMQASTAETALTDAQNKTVQLTSQQKKYAEVAPVLTRLHSLTSARELGFSTEVLWTPYLYAIFAVMPPGVLIGSFDVSGATPMQAAVASVDPLQAPSVMTLTFTGRSPTLPDAAGWVDALNSIPGFSDAWVSSAAITGSSTDGNYYEVQSSVQVNTAAYAKRFVQTKGS